MSNFTKGTWNTDWKILDDGIIRIRSIDNSLREPRSEVIADVYACSLSLEPTDEGLANVRLLTAAPEMYDELYEVLQLMKGKSSYDEDEFGVEARYIEELLARIDGKQVNSDE